MSGRNYRSKRTTTVSCGCKTWAIVSISFAMLGLEFIQFLVVCLLVRHVFIMSGLWISYLHRALHPWLSARSTNAQVLRIVLFLQSGLFVPPPSGVKKAQNRSKSNTSANKRNRKTGTKLFRWLEPETQAVEAVGDQLQGSPLALWTI